MFLRFQVPPITPLGATITGIVVLSLYLACLPLMNLGLYYLDRHHRGNPRDNAMRV